MGDTVKKYVFISDKSWHDNLFEKLSVDVDGHWIRIAEKDRFSYDNLKLIGPEKIFVPHWSYIIPAEIYETWNCIVFHMTDLPFGRGGSPLQNLITRGFKETKISALKVIGGIDTGDVYLKRNLSLEGTARDIFERAAPIIGEMIKEIIEKNMAPQPQEGEVVVFARRKQEESNIEQVAGLDKLYDYIRMLDCEGYPKAFLETEHFKIEVSEAAFNSSNEIINAHVSITKK